jgi:hypothetical protein
MYFSPISPTHIATTHDANFLFFNFSVLTGQTLSGLSDAFTVEFFQEPSSRILSKLTGALLTCDPRSSIAPADITVAQNTLTARRLPTSIDNPTSAMIGNISPGAVALITSTSLYDAVADIVSTFAYDLFIKPGFDDGHKKKIRYPWTRLTETWITTHNRPEMHF